MKWLIEGAVILVYAVICYAAGTFVTDTFGLVAGVAMAPIVFVGGVGIGHVLTREEKE